MDERFILSCESTVDLPYAYVEQRHIPVLFYSYSVNGKTYTDDMCRDPKSLPAFYQMIEEGALPSTTQINAYQYESYFDGLLKKGNVLHVAFGTGMTQSYGNAVQAAEVLKAKYPGRKLVIVDSLCSSSGYGMLVDSAADLRDQGKSIEETEKWLYDWRKRVHHQFYSTRLDFFRRSGRVSGPTAMIATILNICPIMRLDDCGRIIAYDKVRGVKSAIQRTVKTMAEHAVGGKEYAGKCYICHANCPQEADALKASIIGMFPNIPPESIRINDIGTIIASHCGPGTVAVFFYGDERAPKS